MKAIIINNKIYNLKNALKKLKISKYKYSVLKDNNLFKLDELKKYKLTDLNKIKKIAFKKWDGVKESYKKDLKSFNEKYGYKITVKKLNKAIKEHNKILAIYRDKDVKRLTISNVFQNKNIWNNPDRLLHAHDYFSNRAIKFAYNYRNTIIRYHGETGARLIDGLSDADLINMHLDEFNNCPFEEYYQMSTAELQERITMYREFIDWSKLSLETLEKYTNNSSELYDYWQKNISDLPYLIATNPLNQSQ